MRRVQREVFLALVRLPIGWPERKYLLCPWRPVESPGRFWATPWETEDGTARWGIEEVTFMGLPSMSCLCTFCRLAQWEGPCEDAYPTCQHPLEAVHDGDANWGPLGNEPGHDCWGFRPLLPVDAVAEFVSQRLQGFFVDLPLPDWWRQHKAAPASALAKAGQDKRRRPLAGPLLPLDHRRAPE